MKSVLLRVVAVGCPALSLLLALPIVVYVLPHEIRSGDYHWPFWLIGAAVAVGVLSSAGYLRALSDATEARREWVAWSLVGVMFASLVGIAGTVLLAWPLSLLPLVSTIVAVYLFMAGRRRSEGRC